MRYREADGEISPDAFVPFVCNAGAHIDKEKIGTAVCFGSRDAGIEDIAVELIVEI